MRCFGFGILNFKLWSGKSVKGVSFKSLQLYSLVFASRLLSLMRHQGYLPYDKTGDWFYHAVEFLSLAAVTSAIFAILFPMKHTYDKKYDLFGNLHIPDDLGALYLIIPSVILAIFIHP